MESMDADTIRRELTCPVCLDIPRVGDLFQCHNGHLICQADYDRLLVTQAEAKCPQCMAPYRSDPIRNRFAQKFLDTVKIPCRYADKGCTAEMTRSLIETHEYEKLQCDFATVPCRYHEQGCRTELPKRGLGHWFARELHEDDCEFQSFSCIVMTCKEKMPSSKLISHLMDSECHNYGMSSVDMDGTDECLVGWYFGLSKSMKVSSHWFIWEGVVIKFDGQHFYLGLSQIGRWWTAYVCLLGSPSKAKKYRVKITAKNPNRERCQVTYDGPANSLLVTCKSDFEKQVMGLSFSNKMADALKESIVRTTLYVECSIKQEKCFRRIR